MLVSRKSPQTETEYERQCRDILQKQHARLVSCAKALMQFSGWMRSDSLTPAELEMIESIKAFIEKQDTEIAKVA